MLFELLPLSLFGAMAFRIRGGGFVSVGVTGGRVLWGLVVGIVFALLSGFTGVRACEYSALIGICGFLSLLIPHAAYQNMGRWPSPQKTWPGFFLPTYTQAEWVALLGWERADYDCGGMGGVAFFRGLIVFAPFAAVSYFTSWDVEPVIRSLIALATVTLTQPLAYLLGRFTGLSITKSLPPDSAEWGEFWTGAAWVLALAWL